MRLLFKAGLLWRGRTLCVYFAAVNVSHNACLYLNNKAFGLLMWKIKYPFHSFNFLFQTYLAL